MLGSLVVLFLAMPPRTSAHSGHSAGDATCPGSPASSHAWYSFKADMSGSCTEVKAEMLARISGQTGGTWDDPHGDGQYTLVSDAAEQVTATRLSSNSQYTDKMLFTFTEASSTACTVYGCSESQGSSGGDQSTNKCNLYNLLCSSGQQCCYVSYNIGFAYTYVAKSSWAGMSASVCLGGAGGSGGGFGGTKQTTCPVPSSSGTPSPTASSATPTPTMAPTVTSLAPTAPTLTPTLAPTAPTAAITAPTLALTAPTLTPTLVPTAPTLAPTPTAPTVISPPTPAPTVEKATVTVPMIVQGVSYTDLMANAAVKADFEDGIKTTVAAQAGSSVTKADVTLVLSAGSVNIEATVVSDSAASSAVQTALTSSVSSGAMESAVVTSVQQVSSISTVSSGTITASVSTPTTSMSSPPTAAPTIAVVSSPTPAPAPTSSLPDTTNSTTLISSGYMHKAATLAILLCWSVL